MVACDFPFVTGELFDRLASVRQHFEAVAPIQQDGIPQPLCSLYRVKPCLRLAERINQIWGAKTYHSVTICAHALGIVQ